MEITVPRLEQIKALKDLVAELRIFYIYYRYDYLETAYPGITDSTIRDKWPGLTFIDYIAEKEREARLILSDNSKLNENNQHLQNVCSKKAIQHHVIRGYISQIENTLTPHLPYMRRYLSEQEVAELQASIKEPTSDGLSKVLSQLDRIRKAIDNDTDESKLKIHINEKEVKKVGQDDISDKLAVCIEELKRAVGKISRSVGPERTNGYVDIENILLMFFEAERTLNKILDNENSRKQLNTIKSNAEKLSDIVSHRNPEDAVIVANRTGRLWRDIDTLKDSLVLIEEKTTNDIVSFDRRDKSGDETSENLKTPAKKSVKKPSREALQAYEILKRTGYNQTEVAKMMTRELGHKIKQYQVSRWKKDCDEWYEAQGIQTDISPERIKEINISPTKLDMGARTDSRTTGDPRHKADPDSDIDE